MSDGEGKRDATQGVGAHAWREEERGKGVYLARYEAYMQRPSNLPRAVIYEYEGQLAIREGAGRRMPHALGVH